MTRKQVAIVVYDDAEVLDFAGPFEVLAVTVELKWVCPHGCEVGGDHRPTDPRGEWHAGCAQRHLSRYLPHPALVLVAGGVGSRQALKDEQLLAWLQCASATAERVMSVCSGALILARAGMLTGLNVTTHHEVEGYLAQLEPTATLCMDQRFTDNGKILTTGGISAGNT
ncbi:MAG UNVERIFIED_CONTAM: DJ-1/PfpI family protein [Anaerolineae bacterium]|jgi:transcriptional regulator GlxA family with amidase domain